MKKRILLLSSAALASLVLGLTGCSKDDTTNPEVTLNGNSTVDVILNGTYTEENATANDDEDGALTVTTSGTVDVDRAGDYQITYSATDEAGNTGEATRIVHVYNQAEAFAGSYNNCVDTCVNTPNSSFNAIVTESDTVNKLVWINGFGAFGTSVNVAVTITDNVAGAPITMVTNPGQSLGGNALVDNYYPADSKVISAATSSTSFKIHYHWTDGSASDNCTSTYLR
jgi:hypothetical protein